MQRPNSHELEKYATDREGTSTERFNLDVDYLCVFTAPVKPRLRTHSDHTYAQVAGISTA